GGTGSIGAHLVKMLSEQGHTIHVLVRSLKKAEQLAFDNIVAFQGDAMDPISIEKAMNDCEQVYHLAAFAKVWAKDTGEFFRQNVGATENVLKTAVKLGVKKVVVTSTAGALG